MTARRKMDPVAYPEAGSSASYPSSWRHPAATLDDPFAPERREHPAQVMEGACFFAEGLGILDLHEGS